MRLDLSILNQQQLEAVEFGEGPLLVLAGAGTGKTRVITYRMSHLMARRSVQGDRILGFTFTNKAAKEMRERLEAAEAQRVARDHARCERLNRAQG